jgi:hypothetical protein
MAKIIRQKDSHTGQEHHINTETGDVTTPVINPWPTSKANEFVKCVNLVEQIVEKKLNLVDDTTLKAISYSLSIFEEKGKNLFDQVCLFQTLFSTEQLNEEWKEALHKSAAKGPGKFKKLCREKGLEIKINEDEGWEYKLKEPGKSAYPITDELAEDVVKDIMTYAFIERGHCYYFAEFNFDSKICTLHRRSNFVLRILFHINRGKENKRVIEMKNTRGRTITTDIETNQLASFQKFKELTEGAGNFIFEGTTIDLMKIKNKLFEQEKPSQQIDMLGWNKTGKFFAFANGLYNSSFHPVDEHGIVTLHEKNYFIPYHPATDEYTSQNEKLFSFKPGTVSFDEWARAYTQSFGHTGKVAILFGIATLFSDHIFHVRRNFPMLFLYGEGGSGKSRVGTYLQYLWGEPQPPLKLSDRANTDKARIRKMAQYVNAMALFEEFINELDMAIIKTITGIYDRFGYERSNMQSKYGTETVPINSTAFITGNSYPNDDPLMQRVIMIDYNANVRSAETVEAYNKLTQINRQGITHLTGELLQYRSYFVEHYEEQFDVRFKDFKDKCAEAKIVVPDRMCENYAAITTTYAVMRLAGLKLPFEYKELEAFMLSTIKQQNEKRDVGSVTQRFWDIVQQLASEGAIRNEKEFKLNGSGLFIRWTEIHGMYLEKHQRLYRTFGLGKSTMLQKLQDSGHMKDADKSYIGGKTVHGYWFDYDKLKIDLMSVIDYWQAQDRRYAPKQAEKGKESMESKEFNFESQKDEKPTNHPKTDDLPF